MQTNRPKRTDTLTDTQADADRYTERQTETDTQCSVKQSKAADRKRLRLTKTEEPDRKTQTGLETDADRWLIDIHPGGTRCRLTNRDK